MTKESTYVFTDKRKASLMKARAKRKELKELREKEKQERMVQEALAKQQQEEQTKEKQMLRQQKKQIIQNTQRVLQKQENDKIQLEIKEKEEFLQKQKEQKLQQQYEYTPDNDEIEDLLKNGRVLNDREMTNALPHQIKQNEKLKVDAKNEIINNENINENIVILKDEDEEQEEQEQEEENYIPKLQRTNNEPTYERQEDAEASMPRTTMRDTLSPPTLESVKPRHKKQKKPKIIYQDASDDESEEEEIVIVKRRKPRRKTRTIYVEDDEEDYQPIVPRRTQRVQRVPTREVPQRLQRQQTSRKLTNNETMLRILGMI